MKDTLRSEAAASPSVSRRDLLQAAAVSPLALGLTASGAAALLQVKADARRRPAALENTAGNWKPWLLPSPGALLPPAPRVGAVLRNELKELQTLQAGRNDLIRGLVAYWDAHAGVPAWSNLLLTKIRQNSVNPVVASRALALLHVAMADATIAAWNAKFRYRRLQPSLQSRVTSLSNTDPQLPSYVSEHAAVAGAASTVLNYLFPGQTVAVHGQQMTFTAAAAEASLSRLHAGANFRSDVEAGLALGQSVGALAVARAGADGSGVVWDTVGQPGRPGTSLPYWVPTPPAFQFPPLLPLAGTWKPWLMRSGSQFRRPAPPALQGVYPSPAFLAEVAEVQNTVNSLTPDQREIALFWADGGGTATPPGHWIEIAQAQFAGTLLSAPRAARALALVGAGVADSAITCWDNKYYWWVVRPITAIRALTSQTNFNSVVATPPFPSYTSGHSTFSGCSARVLDYLFPGGKALDAFGDSIPFNDAADQAAVSRLYGGIHYRSDNEEGLIGGRQVADLVIARAKGDGAPAP